MNPQYLRIFECPDISGLIYNSPVVQEKILTHRAAQFRALACNRLNQSYKTGLVPPSPPPTSFNNASSIKTSKAFNKGQQSIWQYWY
jgi:hypothetical protein